MFWNRRKKEKITQNSHRITYNFAEKDYTIYTNEFTSPSSKNTSMYRITYFHCGVLKAEICTGFKVGIRTMELNSNFEILIQEVRLIG